MKNNPLYKVKWGKGIISCVRFIAYLFSIILTPITIIVWLFDKNSFKEDWGLMGAMPITFFVIVCFGNLE